MTTFLDLFGVPDWARQIQQSLVTIEQGIHTLHRKVDTLMATVTEALQGWVDYTNALKAQNADLTAQLQGAQATVTQLQETDAAEDAAQAEALTAQIAQQISDALAAAQAPVEQPPVTTEPVESQDPETVEPPVVEEPNPAEPTTTE